MAYPKKRDRISMFYNWFRWQCLGDEDFFLIQLIKFLKGKRNFRRDKNDNK